MLKGTKKFTALLIAASSIISFLPLKAYASERLENKEGSIDEAVSFKDGKYLYKGYLTDEDNDSIYFNDGKSEVELDNLRDYDLEFKYGSKYMYMKDNDDECFVDLSNGNIEEDEELETKIDDLKAKLRSALKKTDRYGKNFDIYLSKELMFHNNNFDNVYYGYIAMVGEDADGYEDNYGVLVGFTDDSANYVDITYNPNMYVYSSKRGKMVKVDKFNDINSDDEVVVRPITPPLYLTQDENYIYFLTHVNVEDLNAGNSNHVFLQKISKHQGEKIDDAYMPESIESYEISNGFDCKEAKDAQQEWVDILLELINTENLDISNLPVKFVAKDSSIYTIRLNDDSEMKISKYDLKKEKVKADGEGEYEATDSKLDVKLLEKDDDEKQDIASGWDSISVDVDGNIWALDKGKIVRFNKLDPETVYTCDRSLTNLDVYDVRNLIAWDATKDGDVFTVVQNKKDDENTNNENINNEKDKKNGWIKNTDGTWSYYKDDIAVKGQWIQDGNWYYLNENGIMETGWLLNNGSWYYLSEKSGAMETGWLEDSDGNWYYLDEISGAMKSNTSVDGYQLGSDGAWIR